jgi:hypothetical protein
LEKIIRNRKEQVLHLKAKIETGYKMKNLIPCLTLAYFITSCSCDRDKENPCPSSEKATSAAFYAYTATEIPFARIVTDSFTTPETVTFEPFDTTAKQYTWIVGDEEKPRYGKRLTLNFYAGYLRRGQPLKVTCIATKDPNKQCFPNDNGVDTSSRFIYFYNYLDTLINPVPIYGYYFGSDDGDPSIKYTVRIGYWFAKTKTHGSGVWLSNLFRECNNPIIPTTAMLGTAKEMRSFVLRFQDDDFYVNGEMIPRTTCELKNYNNGYAKLNAKGDSIHIHMEYEIVTSRNYVVTITQYQRNFKGARTNQ